MTRLHTCSVVRACVYMTAFVHHVTAAVLRRSWCVNCGGELLLAAVDVLMAELAKLNGDYTSTVRTGLEMTIEQCFYCLYGHPAKRTKAKHLQDHTAKKVGHITAPS